MWKYDYKNCPTVMRHLRLAVAIDTPMPFSHLENAADATHFPNTPRQVNPAENQWKKGNEAVSGEGE